LAEWRQLVCSLMIVILPASLMAQDSGRAMLHSSGGVWLNGNLAPGSSAIFPQDMIQTQEGVTAKIDAYGSAVMVEPDTIVQFDGDELVLDHGSLQVDTSRGMRVRVNCLTVIPLAQAWTRYDVIDVDGKVTVVAREDDVKIHYGGAVRPSKQAELTDVSVHHGEQATREERCGAAAKPSQVVNANGAILNSIWAKAAGLTAIGVLTCWALCRGDEPVSPSSP